MAYQMFLDLSFQCILVIPERLNLKQQFSAHKERKKPLDKYIEYMNA